MLIYCGNQFKQPCRALVSHGKQFTVSIFGHQHKAVVIVEKFCFITVGQQLYNISKTTGEAAFHIMIWDIMPTLCHTVLNTVQAF